MCIRDSVCLAYFWATAALKAHEAIEAGTTEKAFYQSKLKTAKFYYDRILPRTRMHVAAMKSGADNLLDMAEDEF